MNAVAQNVNLGTTTELEDAAFKEIFPWRCYSNGMKTSQDFKSLEEASETLAIPVKDIEDAVKYKEGIMGGFIFVKQ